MGSFSLRVGKLEKRTHKNDRRISGWAPMSDDDYSAKGGAEEHVPQVYRSHECGGASLQFTSATRAGVFAHDTMRTGEAKAQQIVSISY